MSGETPDISSDEADIVEPESEQEAGKVEINEQASLEESENQDKASASSQSEIENLQQQIEQQKQQITASQEMVLRAQAELDNMRKRTRRDIENAHKYALEKFVNDLLPVLDSMELGLEAASNAEDITAVSEGMELTMKMLGSTLEKFGVIVVDPQNEKFNPEQHEAVSMVEQEGAKSGTVINVMQKGYELNGRLVRPAMVVVAK